MTETTVQTSRAPTMTALAVAAAEDWALAICPSCHTADARLTNDAVRKGADWHCARCGQRWSALRLATVAAYAARVNQR